jgi:hypothetical protein
MNQLPEGWTVEETRFMWALVDPSGTRRSFGLTEEAVRGAVALQKEFYVGPVSVLDSEKHVDL